MLDGFKDRQNSKFDRRRNYVRCVLLAGCKLDRKKLSRTYVSVCLRSISKTQVKRTLLPLERENLAYDFSTLYLFGRQSCDLCQRKWSK